MARLARASVCVLALVAGVLPGIVSGQAWNTPRLPWGHPDLQGIWNSSTITPLERPAQYANKPFLTEAEVREIEQANFVNNNRDRRDGGAAADVARAYNDAWWDSGSRIVPTRRTSLVIDPPDGRVPALTPEAQARQAAAAELRRQRGPADNPEDRSLWERCITRGVPNVMLSGPYNNNYQIIQTKDHVIILAEMIHDARIVPLDKPHLPSQLKFLMGDSVGHFEGDTLVVETTNFTERTSYRGANVNLKLVERFTRTAPDILTYQVTVHDPTTFTRPWTIELPSRLDKGPIYEYACHEGNHGLEGILRGGRADDRAAAAAQRTP